MRTPESERERSAGGAQGPDQDPDQDPGRVRHLDTRGYACPIPVLMAVRDMLELSPGDVLELVGDDPGIAEDIPAWVEMNDHKLLWLEQDAGLVRCRVEKGETDDPVTRGPVEAEFFDDPPEGTGGGPGEGSEP
jgi:tRNA 2-thiouridine synthesizing protein A